MSVIQGRLVWLESLSLAKGSHPGANHAACAMEAVSYIAGEPWSDHPECASPVITSFLVSWNDAMNDDDRQMLKPYIPRLVGTRTSKKDEETRAWMLTDWLAREYAPAWLRLAGLTDHAELLESLAPLTTAAAARENQPTLDAARAAAWAAAGDAGGDAAWAAAWAAAGDAAWAAAWAAAGDAARDAAWAAAGAAAWAAAGAAAGDAFDPTVKILQQSALLLLGRMIEMGR